MSGRVKRNTIDASGRLDLPINGRSFELLDTQLPVDVEIYRGSSLLETWEDVEAGTRYDTPEGEDDFTTVIIIATAGESVKWAISDGKTTYDPRPHWYDRNPLMITELYSNTPAPHAATERFRYTVPTGKRAFIEIASVAIERATSATVPAAYQANICHFTGEVLLATFAQLVSSRNDVGYYEKDNVGTAIPLIAGEVIVGRTLDVSTGGTVTYRMSLKGTEFNA